MAILSGHKKEKEYIADQNGDHTLVSKWTHADSVEMPNGQTLSEFTFDDSKVSQIQSDSGVSGEYNILLSETANSGTTLTECARKTSQLYWHSNAKLLAVYTDNKGVGIKNDDILMSGTDNTWDGENTSLKTALAAKGTSNLEIGNTATTAMAGNTEVNNVTQTQSNDNNGDFEMLFSGSADNTTRAEGSRKSKYLTYNPSVNKLVLGTASNGSIGISASSTGHEIDVKTTENNKVYASASSMGANLTVKSNVAEPHIGLTFIDSNVTKQMIIRPNDIRLSNNTWDGTNVSLVSALAAKQGTLTPGTNISIVSGVISATDTTYNDFDGSVHGLVPVPASGDSAKFLKGDGTWATPTDTTYSDFAGSAHGLVPAVSTQAGKFLKDDGSWDTPPTGSSSLATLSDVTLTTPTDGQVLKYDATSNKWVNDTDSGANDAVTQTATDSTNAFYELIFSNTADNVSRTEGSRKSSKLTFNPSEETLTVSGINKLTEVTSDYVSVLDTSANSIYLESTDITLGGTNNTWDGTNTSLKSAIGSARSTVAQTSVPASSDYNHFYRILLSGTADDTTNTQGTYKSSDLQYNPIVKAITVGARTSGTTSGNESVAIGLNNTASGNISLAVGNGAVASGDYSYATGYNVTASGYCSHAEGNGNTSSGYYSHTEGGSNTASGYYSHAEGNLNTAKHIAQHVFGLHNIPDPSTAGATSPGNYIEIVGNGTVSTASNARTLDWDGNEWLAGGLTLNGTTADVVLSGTNNTWDGTNTSLKAAIAAAGQGGGGGTTVIANPSGTATDDLTSIQIGSTIYDIPSGGGSASGGGVIRDVLFSNNGTTNPTTITLDEALTDYDEVLIQLKSTGYDATFAMEYDVADLDFNDTIGAGGTTGVFVWYYYTNATTLTYRGDSGGNAYISKIIGKKYNGGGATPVELTKAQYDALTTQEKNDPNKIYFITDYNTEPIADRINEDSAIRVGNISELSNIFATGTDIVHT